MRRPTLGAVLILLPPSEGKSVPRRGQPLDLATLAHPGLTDARQHLLEALAALCAEQPEPAAQVLGLGATQLDEVRRNAGLPTARTARADAIYTGVLYDALGPRPPSTPAARRRAGRWLRITSSLFGLVAPGDRIPAYRLSGGTHLPGVGVVSAYWRERLDDEVRAAAGTGLVVDLRSTTYAGFWRPGPDLARRVAAVRVLQQVGRAACGRQPLQQGHQGPPGARAARARRDPGHPRRPGPADRRAGLDAELGEPGRHGRPLDVVVDEL